MIVSISICDLVKWHIRSGQHWFDWFVVIRASDRQAALDSELKSLQVSLRELESFLKWLHEAETTVNVLSDAAQREGLSQDSAHIKELKVQLEVRASVFTCTCLYSMTRANLFWPRTTHFNMKRPPQQHVRWPTTILVVVDNGYSVLFLKTPWSKASQSDLSLWFSVSSCQLCFYITAKCMIRSVYWLWAAHGRWCRQIWDIQALKCVNYIQLPPRQSSLVPTSATAQHTCNQGIDHFRRERASVVLFFSLLRRFCA